MPREPRCSQAELGKSLESSLNRKRQAFWKTREVRGPTHSWNLNFSITSLLQPSSLLRPGQPRWGGRGPGGGRPCGVEDATGVTRAAALWLQTHLVGFVAWTGGGGEGWSVSQALPSQGVSLTPAGCPRLAVASGPSPRLQVAEPRGEKQSGATAPPAAGGRSEPGAPGIPPHPAALRAPFSRLGAHAHAWGPALPRGPFPCGVLTAHPQPAQR